MVRGNATGAGNSEPWKLVSGSSAAVASANTITRLTRPSRGTAAMVETHVTVNEREFAF
jgi:hypothetical protein